ncbi:DEAD/DEAH box helicase family protein, partial [Ruegeria arenilitoris]|uniref:DEAD/DEAH box helicase family protein n=1 Tax=Ruegeria arenilitoris TaxID=1173585 RepID=UPI00147C760F
MDFSDPDQRGSWYYRGDTGTGKTTAIMWHVARNAASRFVIAVPTRLAADQLYAQLKSWGVDVAVWTQAHDLRHPDPSGFEPSARFFKEQLADHRVVIGTHNFLLSSSSEVARYIGPRDLLIVDEVPLQFDGADVLELTDFCRAWDEANALQSPAMYPLRRVLLWAEEVAGTIEGRRQYHKPELSEREVEWQGVAAMIEDLEATGEGIQAIRRVVSFVLSSFEGRAFVQLQDGGGQNRTVFCTTTMKLPCVKRAIHVSATVHLEGWQVSPYQTQVRECRGLNLDYRNLEIIADAWPKELPTRYNDLLQSPEALQNFKRIIVDLVLKTPKDSKILLVVPKKLLGHAQDALNAIELQFLDRPIDVRITHFKVDVGSNEYVDCTDVILFGLHHAPKTAHIQRGLQFSQADVSQELLDAQTGPLTGIFREVRFDDYKAQIKQLGARGRVRVANADCTCGRMRLWTYQDHVSPQEICDLFPGAFLNARPAAFRKRHGVRHD